MWNIWLRLHLALTCDLYPDVVHIHLGSECYPISVSCDIASWGRIVCPRLKTLFKRKPTTTSGWCCTGPFSTDLFKYCVGKTDPIRYPEKSDDVFHFKRPMFWFIDDRKFLIGSQWSLVNAKCKCSIGYKSQLILAWIQSTHTLRSNLCMRTLYKWGPSGWKWDLISLDLEMLSYHLCQK